jgi:hypothetical protein
MSVRMSAVVEKVVNLLSLGRCAVAEQGDLLLAVEPEAKRLEVVNERAGVAAPFAVDPGVVRRLGGVSFAVAVGHIFFTLEQPDRVVVQHAAIDK